MSKLCKTKSTQHDEALDGRWTLWFHQDQGEWDISSFKSVCTFATLTELWTIIETLRTSPHILCEHIFVMREGVDPLWEHVENRNGGCWSAKINIKDSFRDYANVLLLGTTGQIVASSDKAEKTSITGMSFSAKNQYNGVIQLWSNNNLASTEDLHPILTKQFGYDIVYRIHAPEY